MRSPVLFMVFNRPEQTRQSFAQIRAARPPRLYVAADGPRRDKEGEDALCAEVREIATAVDWPCEVKTLFRKRNLGCRVACSSALSWFFEQEPEGVVIEDDIWAHPDFFTFCDELLEKYRDNPKISVICGTNFQFSRRHGDASYYFSNHTHIWGWASWSRNWKDYDPEMTGYAGFLKNVLPKRTGVDRLSLHYLSCFHGPVKTMTWDLALMYVTLKEDRLSVIPNVPLTRNLGFTSGTHCREHTIWEHLELAGFREAIRHPDIIGACLEADLFDVEYIHLGLPALCREAFRRIEAGVPESNHEMLRMARAFFGDSTAFDEIEVVTLLAERKQEDAMACLTRGRSIHGSGFMAGGKGQQAAAM